MRMKAAHEITIVIKPSMIKILSQHFQSSQSTGLLLRLTISIPHSLLRLPSLLKDKQGTGATLVSLVTLQSQRCRTPLNAPAKMAALKKME